MKNKKPTRPTPVVAGKKKRLYCQRGHKSSAHLRFRPNGKCKSCWKLYFDMNGGDLRSSELALNQFGPEMITKVAGLTYYKMLLHYIESGGDQNDN